MTPRASVLTIVGLICFTETAIAQSPKTVDTKKATSVALLNLVSRTPDCRLGAVVLPSLREKPTNGIIQIVIRTANIPAAGACPARKEPMITLLYSPRADFVGSDAVTIDVDRGDGATSLSYKIVVGGESL